jgi:hypothetical protein
MKISLFVLFATIFEAAGDAILRIALHHPSLSTRIGLFLVGGALLTLYGTSLNVAPVEFAAATGMYIATCSSSFRSPIMSSFAPLPPMRWQSEEL